MPPRYGKISKGQRVPYGALAGASPELLQAYYYYGYRNDENLPELPCSPWEGLRVDPEEELSKKELTKERIRQIQAKALRKMKRPERSATLRLYVYPEAYKTTLEKTREIESLQEAWRKARERQYKLDNMEKNMPLKKRALWNELKPALEDAPWVENLKIEKPDMYQELKELVADIWEMNANEIWNKYTKEQHGQST